MVNLFTTLPMISMLVGPSGSGKIVLLTNMILDIYKGVVFKNLRWESIG